MGKNGRINKVTLKNESEILLSMVSKSFNIRYLFIVALLVLFSCNLEEPTLPSWFTEWRLPIPNPKFVISEEIVNDSTIIDTTDNGEKIIAISIEDSLERRTVSSSDLAVKPENDSSFQTVGDVRLDSPPSEVSDPITAEEILGMPLTSGAQIDIPETEIDIAPQYIVFYSFFKVINVKEGFLQIQFYNDTFLNIRAGMTILIYDSSSAEFLGEAVFSSAIAAYGNDVSLPVDLNGKTFTNVLRFDITMPLVGQQDYTLSESDVASAAYFTAVISEMKVGYADAIVPKQIFSDFDSTSVEDEEDKMITAQIEGGYFELNIDNRLPVNANVEVELLNFYSDADYTPESVVTHTYFLEANGNYIDQVKLDGLHITDYNNGPSPGSIITHFKYNVNVTTIPSDGYVKIFETDSVITKVSVIDSIYLSEFRGIIAPVNVALDSKEKTDVIDSEGFEGSISFDQMQMTMDIFNEIGSDIEVDLNIVGYKNNRNDSLRLQFDQNPFTVPRRIDDRANIRTINLNKDNSNIVEFFEFLPRDIVSKGKAVVNKDETVGEVRKQDQVWGHYHIYSPFYLRITNNAKYTSKVESKDISEDVRKSIDKGDLENVGLGFELNNGLPIGAQLIVYAAADPVNIFNVDNVITDDIVFAAGEDLDGDGFVDRPFTDTPSPIMLTEEQIRLFGNEKIYLATRLLFEDTNDLVKFRQNDELSYYGAFVFKLRINNDD